MRAFIKSRRLAKPRSPRLLDGHYEHNGFMVVIEAGQIKHVWKVEDGQLAMIV